MPRETVNTPRKMKEIENIPQFDKQDMGQMIVDAPVVNRTEEARMAHLYDKVKYYLDKEKIYLNPKLSLANFSLIVGTNTSCFMAMVFLFIF